MLDVEMPVVGGIEAARLIMEQLPAIKVVMLTVCEHDDHHLLEAIRFGMLGYLLKDLRPEQLYDMLRSVRPDGTPVSPALFGRLLVVLREGGMTPAAPAPAKPGLSLRELEVLQLVADGLGNKEIGSCRSPRAR